MTVAGDVVVPGSVVNRRYRAIEESRRGAFFDGPATRGPLRSHAEVAALLPAPWVDGHPQYRACYDTCVEILFRNQHEPAEGSGLVSNYLDAAFNDNLFLWDTAFIVMFAALLDPFVPAVCSLDNFYGRQYADGEICREFSSRTGESLPWWVNLGGDGLYSFFHRDYAFRALGTKAPGLVLETMYRPDLGRVPVSPPLLTLDALNNPVLAWAELVSYRQTGDVHRLAKVLPPLTAYFWAFDEQVRHANGLFVTDWASMDNSPRNERVCFGVDTAAQMALFADNLLDMVRLVTAAGLPCNVDAAALETRRDEITFLVNDRMWNDERGFYFDLDADGNQLAVRTVAAFWTLVAGIAPFDRARRLVAALEDPAAFNRPHRVPTTAADEPGYVPEGGYWRGGVWAPIDQMVVQGLDRAGFADLAVAIATNHVDALARIHATEGTVFEYYSPEHFDAGANDHRDFVGWSGTGPIGLFMSHVIGVRGDAEHRRLVWRLGAERTARGIDRYAFCGRSIDLAAMPAGDGWRISVRGGKGLELVVDLGTSTHGFELTRDEQEFVL